MLSKNDIINELGKGIGIYPFSPECIKENSINLCASKNAWVQKTQTIFCCDTCYDADKRFSLTESESYSTKITLKDGGSAFLRDSNGDGYIILLPFSTTLIETKEVLSLGNSIGGTYHSKVGLASKGIGHIGTMVGPNFSGDSLIAIHNTSEKLLSIKEGESFVSVVFYYLNTPYSQSNPTVSGHTDKFTQFGITLSEEEAHELNADWKKNFQDVCDKMQSSEQYQNYKKTIQRQKKRAYLQFFTWKNGLYVLLSVVFISLIYIGASYLDKKNGGSIWRDRFYNVGFSGGFIVLISAVFNLIKRNSK